MKGHCALLECFLGVCSLSTPSPSRDFHGWRRLARRGAGAGVDWAFGAVCSRLCALFCSVLSGCGCCAVQCSATRVLSGRPCIVRALMSRAHAPGRSAACLPRARRVRGGAAAGSRTSIVILVKLRSRLYTSACAAPLAAHLAALRRPLGSHHPSRSLSLRYKKRATHFVLRPMTFPIIFRSPPHPRSAERACAARIHGTRTRARLARVR